MANAVCSCLQASLLWATLWQSCLQALLLWATLWHVLSLWSTRESLVRIRAYDLYLY
jgi:hypothetical protein